MVVGALGHGNALDVADDVEHEGEVVPERGLEARVDALEVGAAEQLVPRRVEQVRVKQAPGPAAELLLAAIVAGGLTLELGGVLVGAAVIGLDVEAGDHEVEVIGLGNLDKVGEHRGFHPVIAVHEVHELATGAVEGNVARGGSTLVLGVDDVDADVALGHAVGHLAGAVSGAIVDDDELEVAHRLVLEALDGAPNEAIHVVGRYDDRDLGDPLLHVCHQVFFHAATSHGATVAHTRDYHQPDTPNASSAYVQLICAFVQQPTP